MKLRNGFVSNSSSSSFVITNKTDEDKYLIDFCKEMLPQLMLPTGMTINGDDYSYVEIVVYFLQKLEDTKKQVEVNSVDSDHNNDLLKPGDTEIRKPFNWGPYEWVVSHITYNKNKGETSNFKYRYKESY